MTPVYQDKNNNCMQASVASILDLSLDEVPNFMDNGNRFWSSTIEFVESFGYKFGGLLGERTYAILEDYEGIDGLFIGTVYSPSGGTYSDGTSLRHSVVVDKKFNVVHDPKYRVDKYPMSDEIGHNGIIEILVFENGRGSVS